MLLTLVSHNINNVLIPANRLCSRMFCLLSIRWWWQPSKLTVSVDTGGGNMINYCFSNTKPPPRYWLSKVTFRYYISIAKSLALLLIIYVEMMNSYAGIEF